MTGNRNSLDRRQVLARIGLSLSALALVSAAVVGAFAAAFQLAGDARPSAQVLQAVPDDGQRTPDFAGRVVGVWGDALVVDTAAGRRTLQLNAETAVRLPDGKSGSRGDLRAGLLAAVYGAPVDLQTFRVDLVVVLPPR